MRIKALPLLAGSWAVVIFVPDVDPGFSIYLTIALAVLCFIKKADLY